MSDEVTRLNQVSLDGVGAGSAGRGSARADARGEEAIRAHVALKYRPDIDGIRAVAVSAVIVFHAFPDALPGGYVGVDLFFVISGFLISSIIFKGLQNNAFSYAVFYSHRIKRIFPALILVLTFCMVIGWFVLFPGEYGNLGRHIAASAGFVENMLLWRESGYFDSYSAVKPLLHLWSLGIEEQFYIVWPLLLGFLWDRTRRMSLIIVVLLLASFALNIALIDRSLSSAFYFAVTRFWELLAGCLLGYLGTRAAATRRGEAPDANEDAALRNAASILGIVIIALTFVFYDGSLSFPGWWAVPPVLGGAMLVWAGPRTWFNRTVLAHPVMVFVGLISYPLYLWHWPMLTFARIMNSGAPPSPMIRIGLVATTFGLAWLTYQFAEKPVRRARESGKVTVALAVAMLLLFLIGIATYVANGFEAVGERRNLLVSDIYSKVSQTNPISCLSKLNQTGRALNYCLQSSSATPTVALIGDSHAEHLFPGIAKADPGRSWIMLGNSACPPVLGISVASVITGCEERSTKVIDYVNAHPEISTVVLALYSGYSLDTAFAADHVDAHDSPANVRITSADFPGRNKTETLFYGLERAVSELSRAGKNLVIMVDIPEMPFFPISCVQRPVTGYLGHDDCSVPRQKVMARQKDFRAILARVTAQHPDVRVYDPLDVMCDEQNCSMLGDGVMRYRDSNHLSLRGSEMVGRSFIDWFERK